MRILITGDSGFVGSYLAPLCHRTYPQAELFGLRNSLSAPIQAPASTPIASLVADVADAEQVRAAVARAQPNLVFHLAAQASVSASWKDPALTLAINAGGAIHLLEALRLESLKPRVVLVGSGEQYGFIRPEDNPISEDCPFRPANPYAVSKAAQDLYGYQYYRAYGLPIMRVRPFNHFGPGQNETFVVASFARQIALIEAGKAEPVVQVGNLRPRRDFLPVEDVVRAYVAVAERGQPGEAYNVGAGKATSIGEILNRLLEFARVSIEVREDPARLRPIDVPLLVADTSRLQTHTGWKPVSDFDAFLRRTLDYWRATVALAPNQMAAAQ